MKTCTKCLETKPLEAFYRRSAAADGRASQCITCSRLQYKALYAASTASPEHLRLKRAIDARRARNRDIIREFKSVPCADCLGTFPTVCMDFDHVSGVKLFNIGAVGGESEKRLRAEIAKCDVVCANCHRIRTRDRAASALE